MHELVHQTIFSYYGCESEIVLFDKSKGFNSYTIPDENCVYEDSMILAHSINEIVGYTICPFLILLFYLKIGDLIFRD